MKKSIIQREDGFTLVELIITMFIFVFVMAAASRVFTGLLTQFKQQSKIAETNIEGLVGLEIMRQDIEHAGYGIPWIFQSAITYTEPSSAPASTYNEPANSVPRAIFSGNNVDYTGTNAYDGSDYLVIKAINIATNTASPKWTTLSNASPYTRTWDPSSENLVNADRVIVLAPGNNDANAKTLIVHTSGAFFTQFGSVTSSPWPPLDATETRVVYGLTTGADPVRPFNRVDYFILRPTSGMPPRCAPKTGILYKALCDANGTSSLLPLLDCVADMQVVYALDNDEDGDFVSGQGTPSDAYSDDISTLTVQQIRNRVKEVRVYILSHEGQRDPNFTYPSSTIAIPPTHDPATGLGRSSPFDLTTSDATDYVNYRWKLYTLIVKPIDLR
jgi:prepilin-type N-terminal cleavage/methylation domain-containing protein